MDSENNDQATRPAAVTIPVIEEKIRVERQTVDQGGVQVRKEVSHKEVNIESTLTQEDIQIERIPLDQAVEVAPAPVRYEGDTMIVSVVQEELVIQKRLILVEEIRITKRKNEKSISHPESIRSEKVIIERRPFQES